MERSWEGMAAAKRASISAQIPDQWIIPDEILDQARRQRMISGDFIEGLLDDVTLSITSLNAPEILAQIQGRSRTAFEVTRAFCKRAAYAHQLNGCCLEIFFDQALAEAKRLDAFQATNAATVGPLHGLPVSLKDQFHVRGVETTMGYVGWIDSFEGQKGTGKERVIESELVRELRSLGAIPIVKTTVAQGLMSGETNNNILGYNKNPVNQNLASGGSSGGEGAIQALRGSTFGVGTDIGGSVRIPAAFCGMYGFKPSTGRIPYRDAANTNPGQTVIASAVGILGPSLDTLELVFRALLTTEPWLHDPDTINMPWQASSPVPSGQEDTGSGLAFGIIKSNDIARPHPPISRALRMVSKALYQKHHNVIEWETAEHDKAVKLHECFLTSDGFSDVLNQLALSGEPMLRTVYGDKPKTPIPLLDFFEKTRELRAYREEMADRWASTAQQTTTGRPVDAVILPVAPHAAVLPGKYLTYSYSSTINTRDYCSIVVPVTHVNKEADLPDEQFEPMNDIDRENYSAYDPELYDGAPVAVQIVCQRHCEEKLFRIAKVVVDALREAD